MASSANNRHDKHLRYSEVHFQGYWVQLNTLIRRHEDADLLVDGILENPLVELVEVVEKKDKTDPLWTVSLCIRSLYQEHGCGNPPGTFPPTLEEMDNNPLSFIKDFIKATSRGTKGGKDPSGLTVVSAKRWAKATYKDLVIYRRACKHIWETIVATLTSAEATTVIAGLPYGSGPKLLRQIRHTQQRQTTMALYTLFSQLITMQMRNKEGIVGLYGRILEIRTRLANWKPPIVLPDKLIIVCMLRLLPRLFHATRIIIMSSKDISLEGSKDMLLDVENKDAEKVTTAIGSGTPPQATSTALTATPGEKPKPRPNPRDDPKKSAKYHSEGPCSHHGVRCGHASSECYHLHPELKKKKKKKSGSANVADTATAQPAAAAEASADAPTSEPEPQPFGFMNEHCGFAFVGDSDDVNSAETVIVFLPCPDMEYAQPSKFDVSPIIGSLTEARSITIGVDKHGEHDTLSLGCDVVSDKEGVQNISNLTWGVSQRSDWVVARHIIPCNSREIENFVPSILATSTRDCENTCFKCQHARVYPSAHSCEIKLGPSALTQELLCDHMTVVGQHRCQQKVNGEEVNSAGLQNKELNGEDVNVAEHSIAPTKDATPPHVSHALENQKSHHAEHELEDGLVGILDCAPRVVFHSLPTCLYSFITTAAVKELGLETFKTMSPWAGQGLHDQHLDWLQHPERSAANIVIDKETTIPLSVYPCGSHGAKWERSGSYLMSEARIDVSPVCMHVIKSKVPAIILGNVPSFEIRDFSDQYEDWLLQDDGYELSNDELVSKPNGYQHVGPVNTKGKPSSSQTKPNVHDLLGHGYDVYDWFPESSDDEGTESEGCCGNSRGYAYMMANDAHADSAIDSEQQPAPVPKSNMDATCAKAVKAISELMKVNREYTSLLKEEKATLDADREARKKAEPVARETSTTVEAADDGNTIAVKASPPARAKRKAFRGHGWSSKGTKASRRAKYRPLTVGDKIECRKPASAPKVECAHSARAHNNKDCNAYKDWRFTGKQRIRLSQPESPEEHSRLSQPESSEEHSPGAAGSEPKTFIPFNKDGPKVKVKLRREYAPGLETVLPLPEACPSAAVSREPQSEESACEETDTSDDASEILTKQSIRIPGTNLIIQIKCISQALVGGTAPNGTVLDSGASDHLSPVVSGSLSAAPISSIHGLSGTGTPVTGMGKINAVKNVMCCPGTTRRLLSVGSLLDQLNGKITFTKSSAYHQSANGKVTPIASRKAHGLYVVTNAKYALGNNDVDAAALVGNSVSTDVARERITALHRAFGHASKEVLRTLIKQHAFSGISEAHIKLLQPCDACLLGKSHKAPRGKESQHKAETFGHRLCADCSGPFRTQSIAGNKYLLVVVDEYSSWTWALPVASLTEVPDNLRRIIEVALHQRDDTTVKVFRSDGGSEFTNKTVTALLDKHGIVREQTCPDTSYQNGKAERKIRTIFERVRSCLADSGLPASFWADAAVYAAYTLNRTPSPGGISPFQKRYGKKPSVSHMRPFGNPCVIYRKRTVAGKVQDAGVHGTILGYGYVNGKKGFRARVGNTNKVVTSQDIKCGVFPSSAAPIRTRQPVDEVMSIAQTTENLASATRTPNGTNHAKTVAAAPGPIITKPANAAQASAQMRDGMPGRGSTTASAAPSQLTNLGNAQNFAVGAKVQGNWRGHGTFYNATIAGVHARGSRVTYDLIYDDDEEVENGMSPSLVQGRENSESTQPPCGHALVTDCHPAYLANVPDLARQHITPKGYSQAMASKDKAHWLKAIFAELKSVKDQGVYVFVEKLPPGIKALNCLWVFKVKCGPDGKVTRFKARITVDGKSQIYGIDFHETFAPVAFATTIRLLFAIALSLGLTFRQFDIKCAFLSATLPENERMYMRAPPGFGKRGYWHLRKSLYGLRQSPRLFNQHLHASLTKVGFTACTFDPCLYHHTECGAYLVIVVDDMILASPSEAFTANFAAEMRKVYDIKDLGVPEYVIGVRISVTPATIKFTQDRYIEDMYAEHHPGGKATSTPAVPSDVLCMSGVHGQAESPLLPNAKIYRSLVGSLMYALITRPDVATAVSMVARYLAKPRIAHLQAAQRILRYLNHTRALSLVFNKIAIKELSVTAFADSSWANDIDTRRSRYGYAVYVGKCLVSWRSKLHAAVALSTAEAEYCAATEAAKHIKWVRSLVSFMLPKIKMAPTIIYEDNAACRAMVTCAQISGHNKHFELKQHFIRQLASEGVVTLREVGTLDQIADIFTKSLARPSFEKHRESILFGLTLTFLLPGAPTEGGC